VVVAAARQQAAPAAPRRPKADEATRFRVARVPRREDVPHVVRVVQEVRLADEAARDRPAARPERREEPEPVAQVSGDVADDRIRWDRRPCGTGSESDIDDMATVALNPATGARVPTLETERLRLRPWSQRDVAGYAGILADPEVMQFLGSGPRYAAKRLAARAIAPFSDVEARRAIRKLDAHWARFGYGEWAVEERATGRLVGQVGLHHHADWVAEPTKVEVGWLLARDAWGRGYATEGALGSLADAFDRAGLERVVSIAVTANVRSLRVMERIGLSRVGRTHWRGSDVTWYGIDRSDWLRRRTEVVA
jgi:RimJ/RimL family protein N-acetyltransferase